MTIIVAPHAPIARVQCEAPTFTSAFDATSMPSFSDCLADRGGLDNSRERHRAFAFASLGTLGQGQHIDPPRLEPPPEPDASPWGERGACNVVTETQRRSSPASEGPTLRRSKAANDTPTVLLPHSPLRSNLTGEIAARVAPRLHPLSRKAPSMPSADGNASTSVAHPIQAQTDPAGASAHGVTKGPARVSTRILSPPVSAPALLVVQADANTRSVFARVGQMAPGERDKLRSAIERLIHAHGFIVASVAFDADLFNHAQGG